MAVLQNVHANSVCPDKCAPGAFAMSHGKLFLILKKTRDECALRDRNSHPEHDRGPFMALTSEMVESGFIGHPHFCACLVVVFEVRARTTNPCLEAGRSSLHRPVCPYGASRRIGACDVPSRRRHGCYFNGGRAVAAALQPRTALGYEAASPR